MANEKQDTGMAARGREHRVRDGAGSDTDDAAVEPEGRLSTQAWSLAGSGAELTSDVSRTNVTNRRSIAVQPSFV